MHELSIALSIIDGVTEEAKTRGVEKVLAVHLRLGLLSGVVKDALLFSYEQACEGTLLEGSSLVVDEVPVIVYCPTCDTRRELDSLQEFVCTECGTPTGEVLSGRELQITAMEVE